MTFNREPLGLKQPRIISAAIRNSANGQTCIVPGCERQTRGASRGYCYTHYVRYLEVGEHEKVASQIEARGYCKEFISRASRHEDDTCLIWPYSRTTSGDGQYKINRKPVGAHRAVCLIAHGDPPSCRHQAAHSCGNRLCVNPRHLRWATPSENHADKRRHGTSPSGDRQASARLTNEQAALVFADERPQAVIAREFGVHRGVIYRIKRGLSYGEARALCETQMRMIRAGLISVPK